MASVEGAREQRKQTGEMRSHGILNIRHQEALDHDLEQGHGWGFTLGGLGAV